MPAGEVKYTFQLVGDYEKQLAKLADKDNVINIDPLTANKTLQACYFMYQLNQNTDEVKDLKKTVIDLTTKINDISAKVRDLESAATSHDAEISDLRSQLDESNLKVESQQLQINDLIKRTERNEKDNLELERHSRSSNVRVGNLEEVKDEDCKAKTLKVFQDLGLGHVDIENCHRVGEKKPGKTRFMIVRFVRRIERREVMSKRKQFFDAGFPLFEDLPKVDLDVKKKYAAQIDDLHKKKNKCYFTRGAWYVNGVKKFW